MSIILIREVFLLGFRGKIILLTQKEMVSFIDNLISGFTKEDANFTFEDITPYLRPYLEEKYRYQGKGPESVSEDDISKFKSRLKYIWAVRNVE